MKRRAFFSLFTISCCLLLGCVSSLFMEGKGTAVMMIPRQKRIEAACELMDAFASRTGLLDPKRTTTTSSAAPTSKKRYLWTDAFAVCNFAGLSLYNARYKDLAHELVTSVHDTLGCFRHDDDNLSRRGKRLSNSSSTSPTAGGLRIGKELPERTLNQPYDARKEWDRDGQYFHYLTKWMLALDQMSRFTGDVDSTFHAWATDLAKVAADKFVYTSHQPSGLTRMYWKMSIDLSRALVPSQGAQDPLDGYVTLSRLQASSQTCKTIGSTSVNLQEQIDCFHSMIDISPTDDTLGIGGMLVDAYRLEKLHNQGFQVDSKLTETLLSACLIGLEHCVKTKALQDPASYRLAFRELGLSIGLHALEQMNSSATRSTTLSKVQEYASLATDMETFWMDSKNQATRGWKDHLDINEVMLATSLYPDGFLTEDWSAIRSHFESSS